MSRWTILAGRARFADVHRVGDSDDPIGSWVEFLHDIRTPVAAALIGLDLLTDELSTHHERLDQVRLAVEHVRAVLGRAEAALAPVRQVEPARGLANVVPLVDEVVVQVRPLFDAKGVELVTDGVPDAYAPEVDQVALARVLVNVLSNACRYAPPGTAVTVTTAITGPLVSILVRDSGPGFNAAVGEHGWGVGLKVSRALMEDMGGALRLGGSNEGAVVEILLPA